MLNLTIDQVLEDALIGQAGVSVKFNISISKIIEITRDIILFLIEFFILAFCKGNTTRRNVVGAETCILLVKGKITETMMS